jgi:hypothetical protein
LYGHPLGSSTRPEESTMRPSCLRRVLLLTTLLGSLSYASSQAAITIRTPEDLLETAIFEREGRLYLEWEGARWELATDVDSPGVTNPGDGSFHAFDERLVRDALEDLPAAITALEGTILLLPFPRLESMKSSHEAGVVFLSPGVREVHPLHVHATVAHEIGHLVQHRLAPETSDAWKEYVERRGLSEPRFDDSADHRDRPREIFAEDFRLLFGGDLARAAGGQENGDLPLASSSFAVSRWFDALVFGTAAAAGSEPVVFPNPARGRDTEVTIRFARDRADASTADVFDVAGRRVATVSGALVGTWIEFRWAGGGAGTYFVRPRTASATTARILRLQ